MTFSLTDIAAIDEIFTEDCVFYEPRGAYRGRNEIDRVAGPIKATHPDFRAIRKLFRPRSRLRGNL